MRLSLLLPLVINLLLERQRRAHMDKVYLAATFGPPCISLTISRLGEGRMSHPRVTTNNNFFTEQKGPGSKTERSFLVTSSFSRESPSACSSILQLLQDSPNPSPLLLLSQRFSPIPSLHCSSCRVFVKSCTFAVSFSNSYHRMHFTVGHGSWFLSMVL